MANQNLKTKVELKYENYQQWKGKMFSVLVLNDLNSVLKEEIIADPRVGSNAVDPPEVRRYDEWKARSIKARAMIHINVDEANAMRIADKEHGREAWEGLEKFHVQATVSNQQRLQGAIATLKKTGDVKTQEHVDKLKALVQEYRASGVEYSEAEHACQLINSVRGEHRVLCDSIAAADQFDNDPEGLGQWLVQKVRADEEKEKQRAEEKKKRHAERRLREEAEKKTAAAKVNKN